MHIVVLSSADAWHYRDLKRAGKFDHQITQKNFGEISATLSDQRDFNFSADCVIVRTMPAGSLQQVVFRMDLLAQLESTGTLVLNSPKSIETAVDKYLSLAKLHAAGIPVPETAVSQHLDGAMEDFIRLGECVVTKPMFGSMGFGIKRLDSAVAARTEFEEQISQGNVIYQQEFVEHDGFDLRLLVLGDQVLAMKRRNPNSWITNIAQGGIGEPYQPSEQERELAIATARTVGAHFAGVDLIYESKTGRQLVLEVNAVPGWRAISDVLNTDVAQMMIQEINRYHVE